MALKSIFCTIVYCTFVLSAGANCPGGCGRRACSSQRCAPVVPIMLDNCGPNPSPLPPINAPPVQTPLVNKPPVALPACVPPPKTIANNCHCLKTVVKPQVVQQLITVPSIQRYIETTHTPVVEHIQYHGIPINCPPYTPDPPAPAPAPAPPAPGPSVSSTALLGLLAKALAATKPPILPPCLRLAAAAPPLPPCIPPCPSCVPACPTCVPPCAPSCPCAPAAPPSSILPLLLSLAAAAPPPPPPPAPLPPALPPCTPLKTLPPCLLSLLSKLL